MITKQQRKALLFIEAEIDRTGAAPTIAEITAPPALQPPAGSPKAALGPRVAGLYPAQAVRAPVDRADPPREPI